jgi:hypothetical protein
MRACKNYPGVTCDRDCTLTGKCSESKKGFDVARPEPPPVKNTHGNVQDLVIRDIESRKTLGLKKYGTLLQPFNGRDALKDAYEESLDQTIYLRQLLEERALLTRDARRRRTWRERLHHFLTH